MKELLIDGVRVLFERRKYGTGASTKFFTWLLYHDGEKWETHGDPWPSSVIPKRELAKAMLEIKIKLSEPYADRLGRGEPLRVECVDGRFWVSDDIGSIHKKPFSTIESASALLDRAKAGTL